MIVRAISQQRVLAPADPSIGRFDTPSWQKADLTDDSPGTLRPRKPPFGDRQSVRKNRRQGPRGPGPATPWVLGKPPCGAYLVTRWAPGRPPCGGPATIWQTSQTLRQTGHLAAANRGTLNTWQLTLAGRAKCPSESPGTTASRRGPSNSPGLPGAGPCDPEPGNPSEIPSTTLTDGIQGSNPLKLTRSDHPCEDQPRGTQRTTQDTAPCGAIPENPERARKDVLANAKRVDRSGESPLPATLRIQVRDNPPGAIPQKRPLAGPNPASKSTLAGEPRPRYTERLATLASHKPRGTTRARETTLQWAPLAEDRRRLPIHETALLAKHLPGVADSLLRGPCEPLSR
jgi:hypothetical protein